MAACRVGRRVNGWWGAAESLAGGGHRKHEEPGCPTLAQQSQKVAESPREMFFHGAAMDAGWVESEG